MLTNITAKKLNEETIEDYLDNKISHDELIKRLKLLVHRTRIHGIPYYPELSKLEPDPAKRDEILIQIIEKHTPKVLFRPYSYEEEDIASNWNDDDP